MQMSIDQYGYSEYLARNDDGSLISCYEFRAAVQSIGMSPEQIAPTLGVSHYTVRRWMVGAGLPNPDSQQRLRDFIHYVRISRAASYAALLEPYLATGDDAPLYRSDR